jgi:hypothetical protein
MRRIPMTMQNWIEKLNGFLQLNDRDILTHAGNISHELAAAKAEDEYEKFNIKRIAAQDKTDSDFDKTVKKLEQAKRKLPRKRNSRKGI